MSLYRNRYRIESARLKGWDYRNPGGYFVTICCKDHECYFGNIQNGKMMLNALGGYAWDCWMQIPSHFPNATLDQFVVMPNHVHGIIVLHTCEYGPAAGSAVKNKGNAKPQLMSAISPLQGSLATILRSFKSAVTQRANEQQIPFAWQARFHDHIIRDEQEWQRIANYIANNPRNWKNDKFNKKSKRPGL